MTKTLIDIDDELLARVMTATHSTTKKEAVNKALALSLESDSVKRMEALRRMQRRAQEGLLDFDALDDDE
ncbi:type II toxin-antitoxin system VapB family antitoxin [Glycomyces terrestris]|uniref:Type II toxin-antitoxin system VapB family antitoxin n=1 Tax=Glycomyces terrestris TaxID=2493553 RepID=A0A426UXR8_9ACTN|nr:type II toxin-antitoxin system VapB family antitoxin [Glycomyces terrestris]RRR99346.1 type II toxin-antitoxin system VapB family antitoxin [Glycomyces terrestris]